MTTNSEFMLSLNNNKDYLTLFSALNDKKVREGLITKTDLTPAIKEVILLLDDITFAKMTSETKVVLQDWVDGKTTLDTVHAACAKLDTYAATHYPEGRLLLDEYSRAMKNGGVRADSVAGNTNVVGNAEAGLNAVAWANGAAVQDVGAGVVVVVVGSVVAVAI